MERAEVRVALNEAFDRLRVSYFPRWRAGASWGVMCGLRSRQTNEDGFCDTERRIILVRPDKAEQGGTEFARVLIHEMAHAVRGAGHGVKFRNRLLDAARAAEAGGDADLAAALHEEVRRYAETPRLRASDLYAEVVDHVSLTATVPTYDAVVVALCWSHGLTPEELRRRYRRLGRVYDDAVGERFRCERLATSS